MLTTVDDCTLFGKPIAMDAWHTLGSDQLAAIVDKQEPGHALEDAANYDWRFELIPLARLTNATEDGEPPAGGWASAHRRNIKSDLQAVKDGSPEYAGRDAWLRETWCPNTAIYPLYVVEEAPGELRLWDGYRRLAGAFFYGVHEVAALVGRPRKKRRS